MSSWGDLSQAQMGYYIAFRLGGDNNHPDMPGNNDPIGYHMYTPSEGEINSVSDTGDELVRTINYRLTEAQANSVRDWVFYHGTNLQIGRLTQNDNIINDNIDDNIIDDNIINDNNNNNIPNNANANNIDINENYIIPDNGQYYYEDIGDINLQ